MPRRSLLTPADRTGLLAFPTTDDELIQHYTFAEPDLSVIRQRRGSLRISRNVTGDFTAS